MRPATEQVAQVAADAAASSAAKANYVGGALSAVGGLAADAATALSTSQEDPAGAGFGNDVIVHEFVVTPEAACTIEFTAAAYANNINGDAGNNIVWRVTPAGGSTVVIGGSRFADLSRHQIACIASFSAAAGVALTFQLRTTVSGPAIQIWDSVMRVTQVKR
jgi:hypothetical protein